MRCTLTDEIRAELRDLLRHMTCMQPRILFLSVEGASAGQFMLEARALTRRPRSRRTASERDALVESERPGQLKDRANSDGFEHGELVFDPQVHRAACLSGCSSPPSGTVQRRLVIDVGLA
jgi:hypothetical protein